MGSPIDNICMNIMMYPLLLYVVVLLLALHCCAIIHTHALQTDIKCLKSIKDSLEDPLGYLSTWDFSNNTEGFICSFMGVDCWHLDENKVINIQLSNMGLRGPFPSGIENCSSLTGLDLSSNHLNGTIPSDVGKIISRLTTLDLSSNRFSGEIPVSLANCTYLNVLKLDDNELTGQIPPQFGLLGRIKVFSVANNRLTGSVPTFKNLNIITVDNLANNEGLCGGPWRPAQYYMPRKATVIEISSSVALQQVNTTSSCPEEEDIFNHDMIVNKLEKFVSRMSFMEMANATSNFSQDNIVGCGTLGKVYKATPPNGWLLAIKRLHETENLDDEFASEIMTLGRLRYQNLVPLIGFCSQGEAKLLVYKFMPNGSLHDWLHSTEDKAKALEWPLRMKIAVGVAKALSWLHYTCRLNVVHNGLSSKCILLDHNFEPRISKFWEATILNPNDTASASWSVLAKAEECAEDNFSPYTKDVYCFGIALLELITGKEAYELGCCTEIIFGGNSNTTSPFQIDAVLKETQGFDDIIISQFFEIGKSCVKFMPNQRPTMLQVYESLTSIAQAWVTNNG